MVVQLFFILISLIYILGPVCRLQNKGLMCPPKKTLIIGKAHIQAPGSHASSLHIKSLGNLFPDKK